MSAKTADIIGSIGPKGSGKTTICLKASKANKRVIRYNVNKHDDTMRKGAHVIKNLPDLISYVRKNYKNGFTVCYEGGIFYNDYTAAFVQLCDLCVSVTGIAILADESHEYMPHSLKRAQGKGASDPYGPIRQVVTRGRHVQVPLYWTSQTPRTMGPTLRSNSDVICVFKAADENYMTYLKQVAKDLIDPLFDAPKYSHIAVYQTERPELIGPAGKKLS